MTTTFRQSIQDFDAFGLRNEAIEIAVMPELGAKIVSLVHRKTGREWMWSPPQGPRFVLLPTGSPFEQSSLVGADECLPTVAPCRWRGLELTDHGEVWSGAWELDAEAFKEGSIVTRLRLPISPLWIERRISLGAETIHLDYTLRNLSSEPFEYLWAFHPLLKIEEGDRILLPPDCRRMRTDAALNCPLGVRGDAWDWPNPIEGVDLSQLDLGGESRAVKLFTDPLTVGYAAVQNEQTGDFLAFEFDTGQIDTLGIWINRGGWNGYHHLALEPATGAPDALDIAVHEWKRFARLSPGETRRWGFRMVLDVKS